MPPHLLTYDDDGLLLDGRRHQIISGSICYFRLMPEKWTDCLRKLAAIGANAVEVYVPWNFHEPQPGNWHFTGRADVVRFLRLAQAEGLAVLLRPGPFICAEWEMGGLPWWLLASDPPPQLRSSDPAFLGPVEAYFQRLFAEIKPLLCSNGGPIFAIQIENEYGYWGTDKKYLQRLRDIVRSLAGPEPMLFTVDGCFTPETQQLGGLDGDALRTASFGSRAQSRFQVLREAQSKGPLIVMEFWVGWFTTWGGGTRAQRPAADVANELKHILALGASVNLFVFAGGTSFGFTAGANLAAASGCLEPHITSYDYDGLLTETCALTEKYHACRHVIAMHTGRTDLLQPLPESLTASPALLVTRTVELQQCASLFAALPHLAAGPGKDFVTPLPLEMLGEGTGYVFYRYTGTPDSLRALGGMPLKLYGVRDFALILCDGIARGTWDRSDAEVALELPANVSRLEILVEVTARVNFGPGLAERKGLTGHVRAGIRPQDERELFGWESLALPMRAEHLAKIPWRASYTDRGSEPQFFRGTFELGAAEEAVDMFVRVPELARGFILLNGFNLGWHRREGPQLSLYAPATLLRVGENEIIVFELLKPCPEVAEPVALLEDAPRWGHNKAAAAKAQALEVFGFIRQVGIRRLCGMARRELGHRMLSGALVVLLVLTSILIARSFTQQQKLYSARNFTL